MPASKARKSVTSYTAPALEKGLDILELLANAPVAQTQQQIAVALGRSASELFRMLDVLERRGFIVRDAAGASYRLTLRLFELAHREPSTRRLLDAALPLMEGLAQSTGQSNHLVIHYADRIVVVGQTNSPGDMGFSVKLGAHFPFRADRVSVRVLTAFQTPERRAALIDLMIRNDPRPPRAAALARRIGVIARQGYEERVSDTLPGITDICFPVFDASGAAIATLTQPFLKQREMKMSITAARRAHAEAAAKLSGKLGSRDMPG
jgi:DNA-binding IclR family transcriptional regulator